MAHAAILIAYAKTVEFAIGFVETVSASKVTTEGTVNMVNRDNEWHAFLDFMA
ncbi:hypothetical protein VULLAG_LOCUS7036 [Vulpes lagopus]